MGRTMDTRPAKTGEQIANEFEAQGEQLKAEAAAQREAAKELRQQALATSKEAQFYCAMARKVRPDGRRKP